MCMRMHAQDLHTYALCMRTHTRGMCAHARVPKTKKERFSTLKLGLKQISHRLGAALNPYFQLYND